MRLPAWLLAACLLASPMATRAQDVARDPGATPQPGSDVRDPDFGVQARHFGLERRVEMYQWRGRDGAYSSEWSSLPLDSSSFPPGHDNPPFPLQGKRWIADPVTVDGLPLDPRVIEQLGEWREFRPSFNALPGNLAATFQPEGDGLGSAENPLAPEVGDLRIRWRELVLPPLQDRIALRNGRWQLLPDAAVAGADPGDVPVDAKPAHKKFPWWVLSAGVVALGLVAVALGRRRRRRRR
jgi:hypothetical protein